MDQLFKSGSVVNTTAAKNRQIEEVSNRLTEDGTSKFERNHAGSRLRLVEVDQAFGRRSTPKRSVGFQLMTYESGGDNQGQWIYWCNDY